MGLCGSSKPKTYYEGVWEIKSVHPLENEQAVLVNFITAWFEEKEQAETPTENCWDYGPNGKSVQSVKISLDEVPTEDEWNAGNREGVFEYLTENLNFETKEE